MKFIEIRYPVFQSFGRVYLNFSLQFLFDFTKITRQAFKNENNEINAFYCCFKK